MPLYESTVVIIALVAVALYRLYLKKRSITVPASFAIQNVQGAFLILGALGVVAVVAFLLLKDADSVTICKQQEQTIATALSSWESTVQKSYAAGTTTVKIHSGTTAGTFSNPNSVANDYLQAQPVDPVNPSGLYSLTVTAKTVSAPESYKITCPGPHSSSDMAALTGSATATLGQVQLQDGAFSAI